MSMSDTGEQFQWCRPAGLAMDEKGLILVADWYNNRLVVFAPTLDLRYLKPTEWHEM